MPKVRRVYRDAKGSWFFKAASHKDPLTGQWQQVTGSSFATAAEASRTRQAFHDEQEAMPVSATLVVRSPWQQAPRVAGRTGLERRLRRC